MESPVNRLHALIVEKSRNILLDVNSAAKRLGITPEEVCDCLDEMVENKTITANVVSRMVFSIHLNGKE